RSGSLSTARAGAALGRIVGAWPGSRGCERLLASGAALVEGVEDVEAALAGTPRHRAAAPLDPVAAKIAEAIAAGARGVDAIIEATGLPVRTVLRALPAVEVMSARKL
ncbi:MAG: DNA-protecting protein DprA, partial [Acidobacteriota bacterium]